MKDKQAKYPQLRFKDFTDPWEERKFKDILKTHSFRSYLADVSSNGEYEIIQQGDNPIVGYSDGKPFTNYKDVTLFGDHTVSLYKPHSPFFVATDGIKILSADNFDGDYLYTTLERYKPSPQGYKRHFTILKNHDVWFTGNIEEQQKIGSFFSQLDNTIALHQRKLAKLKKLKQGYLQKLFPKNGSKFPQLRFAEFADAWEQRKFKDFITKSGKKNTKNENCPAYSVSNKLGLVSQADQFDGGRLDSLDKTAYKFVYKNEFAYNPARVNVGSIAFNNLDKTVIVSSLYVVLKMSEKLDNEYVLQFIKSPKFIEEVKRNTEGSVREYLFFDNFKNIRFPYTKNIEEQIKIGLFFKQLDDTITLHQRKLEKLQELKKGYLQKMSC